MTDHSETWLKLQKALRTYEAAAALNQWQICVDASADIRVMATALMGYAMDKQEQHGA